LDNLAIAYGDYELTYQQANQRINRLANALRGLGIEKGSNVAILLHNCPEFLEALYACFKAGLGMVPINFRLHSKECSFIIDNSEAVAVIGVPDEKWGEAIKAIVALKEGRKATEEEIINFCKEYLASYKKSKSVEFIDAILKNPYGKVLKRKLREKYWVGEARRVR